MVRVEDVKKRYGKKEILKGISFEVNPGEIAAIVGQNGCGKTTLLRILSGALKPDEGSITYFGADPLKKDAIFHDMCGYVPQGMPLIEELTVRDNVKLWSVAKNGCDQSILDEFDLNDILDTVVEKLSGGMKRRLTIALSLLNRPQILLLDEPTSALDLYYKSRIQEYIAKFRDDGGIVIMTSHDEPEIMMADKILMFRDGMIELCSTQEVVDVIKNKRQY